MPKKTGQQPIDPDKAQGDSGEIALFSINQAPMEVFWIRPDASLAFVNDTTCELLGYSRQELSEMTVFDIDPVFPPEAWPAHWEELRERKSFKIETVHQTKGGRRFPVEVVINYLLFNGQEYNCAFARDISPQKAAEAELKRIKAAIDNTSDLVAIADLQGNLLYANQTGLEMVGRAGQDITSLRIPDFHSPEIAEKTLQVHIPAVMQHGIHAWENVVQHVDGHTIPVSQVSILIRGEAGEPEYMSSIMRDISERQEVERQLRENQNLLQAFLDNMPDIAFVKDVNGRVIVYNQKLVELFGQDDEPMLGKTVYDLVPEKVAEKIWASELEILNSGQVLSVEEVVPQKGGLRTKLTTKFPLYDAEGNVHALGGLSIDITDRQEAKKEQERQHALLNSILASLPVGVWVADQQFNVLLTNKTQQDMMGRAIVDAQGNTHVDLYDVIDANSGEMYDETKLPIVRTMGDGQPHMADDMGIRWPDGKIVPVMTTTGPLLDAEGKQIGAVAITQDITERHQAQEKQAQLQQELIRAQQRAIQELSTPVIPIMERILVMPLVGSIDSLRAKDIMRALLAGISQHRAKVVILDVTGVPIVDSGVANHLNKTIMAARLKGARTIVTGITDAVAETVVDLGIDWTEIETLSDLQTGLIVALGSLGTRLTSTK